jgi:hypothetical protein
MASIKQVTDSPYLRGTTPVKPEGPHLQWQTDLSEALKGACGSGPLYNGPSVCGGYKAVGGLVSCWFDVNVAETATITFPEYTSPGPCHLSDGTVLWAEENNKITIIGPKNVKGWYTFRG